MAGAVVEHEVAGHLVEQSVGDAEQGGGVGGAAGLDERGGDPLAGGSRARGTTTSRHPRACPGAGSPSTPTGGAGSAPGQPTEVRLGACPTPACAWPRPTPTSPDGVLQALRDRFAAVRAELGLSLDYPADALAEAEQVAADAAGPARARRDRPAVLHRSTRPARWTSTRRCTSSATATGTASATPSPTCPAFVRLGRRARPGDPRARPDRLLPGRAGAAAPGGAERGGREPAAGCRAPRLRLGPAPRRRGGADRRPRCTARWCAASSGSTTRTVQAAVDAGTDDERFLLLREIGERRIAQERARGGASLPMPEQQVTARDGGGFTLEFRPPVAGRGVERAGLAAHRHGRRDDDARRRRRGAAHDAGPDAPRRWRGSGGPPAAWASSGRRTCPTATSSAAWTAPTRATSPSSTRRRRCSAAPGYTAFDGEAPAQREHAAVAAPYAHVTAPLRRLVDRFGLVVCEAVPRGVRCRMPCARRCPHLADLMTESDRRARAAERACADATEAAVLHGREGEHVPRRRRRPHRQGHGTCSSSTCRCSPGSPASAPPWATRSPARLESADVAAGVVVVRADLTAVTTPTRDALHWRGRVGRTVASVGNHRRGRSGLRRAGWWPTATRGDPRDSATENRPPRSRKRAGARVKRWCKRPPAAWVTRSAR